MDEGPLSPFHSLPIQAPLGTRSQSRLGTAAISRPPVTPPQRDSPLLPPGAQSRQAWGCSGVSSPLSMVTHSYPCCLPAAGVLQEAARATPLTASHPTAGWQAATQRGKGLGRPRCAPQRTPLPCSRSSLSGHRLGVPQRSGEKYLVGIVEKPGKAWGGKWGMGGWE